MTDIGPKPFCVLCGGRHRFAEPCDRVVTRGSVELISQSKTKIGDVTVTLTVGRIKKAEVA